MASLKHIAADVVTRARAGDQNAMGLIAETRQSSLQPEGKKARKMLEAILEYCEKNPVSMDEVEFPPVAFGSEALMALGQLKDVVEQVDNIIAPEYDIAALQLTGKLLAALSIEADEMTSKVASLILAHGPPLLDSRIAVIRNVFPDKMGQIVFTRAANASLDYTAPEIRAPHEDMAFVGEVVARARVMQMIWMNPKGISEWSKQVACEVGAC